MPRLCQRLPHLPHLPLLPLLPIATAAILGLTGGASVAAPLYAVHTYTEALDVEAGLSTSSGYNTRQLAGNLPQIDATLGGYTSTNCGSNQLGCSPGFSVSPANGSTATSASSQAVMTVSPPPFNNTTADARAYADLATGKVGVYASGERRFTQRPIVEGTFGMALARLSDTLTFQVAGASAGTHTPIGVRVLIDGQITDLSGGRMNFNFDFGGASAFGGVSENGQNDFVGGSQNSGWINPIYTVLTPELIQFDALYDLVGASSALPLLLQMTAFAGAGATNFAQTGAVQFTLPAGVSYSAGSGVFLSANANTGGGHPVPEPGSLALLAAALSGLAAARRRAA